MSGPGVNAGLGATGFFGPGSNYTLDSTKPMTVVTQFITSDGTDAGDLVEMRRFYVQNGKKIANPMASYGADQITDSMCTTQKQLFGDVNDFAPKGDQSVKGVQTRGSPPCPPPHSL